MNQISILGCGWLGLPLAKKLVEIGYSIKGSTTSSDKLPVLNNAGINPFLISVYEKEIKGNFQGFLENSGILIVDIPPKLRGSEKENFVSKIQTIISLLEQSSIKKVLFISSTSVYADDNSIITEKSLINPDTESGKQLFQSEQLLSNCKNFETTILRFGGLIGEDRHPIRFLAGRTNLENPEGPINLIHQTDCIGIILEIIKQHCWGEVFNAVAPFHPGREDYYTQKAITLQLPLPLFNQSASSFGKTISSKKLEKILQYQFLESTL